MRRAPYALIATAVAAVLGLAGCSNDKDFNPAASATTRATGTVAPAPTGRPASDDPFCNFFAQYNERFGRVDVGLTDPQQIRSVFQEAANAIREAQATAPEAIKADVGTLHEAFQALMTILQQANYDFSKVSPASLAALSAPNFVAASDRLDAYTRDHCL